MTTSLSTRATSERGVMLIIVAFMMLALLAISAFALENGALWYSRGQAQNAADAGALAGAMSRAYDERDAAGPLTTNAANATAKSNLIGNVAGGVAVTTDDTACPSFSPIGNGPCVRVDVFRDGTNQSTPLPTYLAPIMGIASQGVKATATAQVQTANASNCLKPWMIPDKFIDSNGNLLYDPGDVYRPPTDDDPTGYTLLNSVGEVVVVKSGTQGAIVPSNYFEIGDANIYKESITGCEITAKIGDPIDVLPGNRKGPTKSGTNELIAQDPDAMIDDEGNITGSCAPGCAPESPRLVAIAVYDPREYAAMGMPSGGNYELHIVNILSMFIRDVDNNGTVTGVFVRKAGLLAPGGGGPGPTGGGFLTFVTLVR